MQTRQNSYIDLDNLWLTLCDAIKTNSKAIDFLLDQLIMHLDKGKYKKEARQFVETYKKMGEPLPSHPIFFLDKQEEKSHDTLLILAVKNGKDDVVAKLLKMGAMPHFENREHETALNEALKTNNLRMGDLLLIHGTYFNRKHLYVHFQQLRQHQEDWLTLFKKYNINLSIPDSTYYTAMDYAITERDFALIRLLMAYGMEFNPRFVLTSFFPMEHQKPWVDFLIETNHIEATDSKGFNALHHCISSKNIDAIKSLILAGAKVTQNDINLLYEKNLGEIVDLLFESRKIQPDPQKMVDNIRNSIVPEARHWVNLLIKTKNVNIKNTVHKVPAIILMTLKNDEDSVCKLLESGAEVKHRDVTGRSAIQFAMQQRNPDIALKLAEHGAQFSKQEVLDTIYKELSLCDSRWLDLIIFQKGDLNARDSNYQETPLIIAAYLNDVDRALKLLAIDSKPINARSIKHESALIWAIQKENIKMIHALLPYGADIQSEQTRNEIFKIIKKQIDSGDASVRYAALSCLTELHEISSDHSIDKLMYKQLLSEKSGSIKAELEEACSLFPKEVVTTVISPFLLFQPPPKTIVKDEKPNPAPGRWQSL